MAEVKLKIIIIDTNNNIVVFCNPYEKSGCHKLGKGRKLM